LDHITSRRQFVQSLGVASLGLLTGCGLPGQASVPAHLNRLGYLSVLSAQSDAYRVEGFRQGLLEFGWAEGQNLLIDWGFAEDQPERLPDLAAELVLRSVDLIVVRGTAETRAAQQATATIPIVMMVSTDPVGSGLVTSLAHPGGNVTGGATLTWELSAKQLQLLTETAPGIAHVAVFWNGSNPALAAGWRQTQEAARALGIQADSLELREPDDVERAIEAATAQHVDALLLIGGPFTNREIARIVDFAARERLPAMYVIRPEVAAGGLMAYGPHMEDNYRRAGYYVDRILRGANPADLPIEQPKRFDLLVNLKTAQALGLTFPEEIMRQVTEVIE
jgi:putative ABC transport system substrate-binding protein